MSGAAMSLTAATSGFLVLLLSAQVIQGGSDWGVTYTPSPICALKGSTVEIHCSYSYPSGVNTTVERTFWFTKLQDKEPVDLRADTKYAGRVQYHCANSHCTLIITDLRESDSAVYKFRFITNQPGGKYVGSPGVTLSVTGFQVKSNIESSCSFESCVYATLTCHSTCRLPHHPSYIWYKNGEKRMEQQQPYDYHFYPKDSYSCALKGHEDVHSPLVCVYGRSCNKVMYTDRSICAFKGSSVEISCTYNSVKSITSQFWFSSNTQKYNMRPKDISQDHLYDGRVYINTRGGNSTLRITNLRVSDSAQYRFKFKAGSFEWESGLPGTTLTVTDADLQVQVIWSPAGPKLICHSSCLLSGPSYFIWYKNETEIWGETSFSYGGYVNLADNYSCAYQSYHSPPVYAPKVPTLLKSFSGDIMKDDSVTLTCSSDANPAAKYTWYKKNQTPLTEEPHLFFSSIQSSDSGEYYCAAENELGRRMSEYVTINVQYAPNASSVSVSPSAEIVEGSSVTLTCSSDANPAAKYTWYKENQTLLQGSEGIYHFTSIHSEDRGSYHCMCHNQHGQINSSSIFVNVQYAPKLPSVSVSPSAEIVEGRSVTLTCSSDANPAAKYTWYKKTVNVRPLSEGPQLVFSSIQSSDSGQYYCRAENKLGSRTSHGFTMDVKYAPRAPSVSVSPSGKIMEGSSVTLTCSSDANPAAKKTWYMENQKVLQGSDGVYQFISISSEDRGKYYCTSENQHGRINSSSIFIDVQYAPKLPSVSVSPSAEIVEGSSVTLTCSSDANPAANYTWYKEDEDSPKASGQIFTITDITAEHSGNYYCEAQNTRGRHSSTFNPIIVSRSMKSVAAGSITAIFLVIIFLLVFLFIRRKRSSKQTPERRQRPDDNAQANMGAVYDIPRAPRQTTPSEQQDDHCYASVSFSKNQEDPLYSNVRLNQPNRHREEEEDEDDVEYSVVNCAGAATQSIQEEPAEDSSVLYSTVIKKPRV